MKLLLLASALAACATLGLQELTFAHGGTYRGPGDTTPPGGGGAGGSGGPTSPGPGAPGGPGPTGPGTPAPGGPTSPGGSPGGSPSVTPGGAGGGPDLTGWSFWWEFNKEPYLNLKAAIWGGGVKTGTPGWFLGEGAREDAKDTRRPSDAQIRQKVVPALLRALETETNNDILTGCMIALAKIGDATDESGESRFEAAIKPHLKDGTQEIAETAAVSIGILANDHSKDLLIDLMSDNRRARDAVGSLEVDYRTRAFAAYGLALLGAKTQEASVRHDIVKALIEVLESEKTSTRDLKVACLISLGLVPLDPVRPIVASDEDPPAPESCRSGQIEYLLRLFENEADYHHLIRAHAPAAAARLLDGLPVEEFELYKARIARTLLEKCDSRSKEPSEILQSSVLALGQLGDSDSDPLDVEIRDALIQVPKAIGDQQTRNFSLIALAQVGGRPGEGAEPSKDVVSKHLLATMSRGKSSMQSWAGLSIGVYGRAMLESGRLGDPEGARALRDALEREKNDDKLGAFAIAAGILQDLEAQATLLERLESVRQENVRGYIAVGLGLMGSRGAITPIQRVVKESKYQPELLRQAAVALGLLGDKDLVDDLIEMLREAKGLASQAALASALGTIGDARSIDPLVAMLENQDLTASARGFAAVALGIVADKEALPWNSKLSVNLNYRATTETLNDAEGLGILNIL